MLVVRPGNDKFFFSSAIIKRYIYMYIISLYIGDFHFPNNCTTQLSQPSTQLAVCAACKEWGGHRTPEEFENYGIAPRTRSI